MGVWNFYFIAKLFLYGGGYIGFHVWLNLVFFILLAIPVSESIAYAKYLRIFRQLVAIPAGFALFYYDTWLPPFTRIFTQASEIEGFSLFYMTELLGRFVNPLVVAGLALSFVIYYFAKKKLRIASFVFIAILAPLIFIGQPKKFSLIAAAPVATVAATDATVATAVVAAGNTPVSIALPPPSDANLIAHLNAFYRKEAKRAVSYTAPAGSDEPFDVIFLQICSLAWDDLDFTQQKENPLFNKFDIVFTNFSSGASYSGPAAIRFLRGSCGQSKHKTLYDPAPAQCLTMDDLQQAGFEPQLAMNHDGHYGGFLEDVREGGGLKATPFAAKGLPAYLQSFDGTAVHDDYAVLTKWWEQRTHSSAARVALFYNTISLHDGNYYSGHRTNSMEIYPARLKQLLGDVDRFFSELQASGRRAVVVFVPEHGASVRGDKMQIAGMREIPSPRISLVPVGIKLIGMTDKHAKPLIVSAPSSYLAISQLVSDFITVTPFGKNALKMEDYVRNLPTTEFVAENSDVVVMRYGNKYFIRSEDAWLEYDPE